MDLIMKPARIATSKPARQTYLNTVLFMIASGILFCVAAIAYILFYLNHIPQIGTESTIYLQYGAGPHPYGITSLSSTLVAQQAYDITLSLHVPRSPPNLNRGNFMLSLSLLPAKYTPVVPMIQEFEHDLLQPALLPEDVVFSARRSCILTYTSRLVSLSHRILHLPLYLLRLRSESEILSVPMGESVVFQKGRKNLPVYALLEVQAGQDIHVYDVRLHFKARFGGIRWLMYNHRIISFILFTTIFWFSEMFFAALTWVTMSIIFRTSKTTAAPEEPRNKIKREGEENEPATEDEPDLSDTPRTFPTSYWKKPPLRYEPQVKDEDIEAEAYLVDERDIKAEADDEDDDVMMGLGGGFGPGSEFLSGGARTDSGMGSSFSEGGERSGGLARRRSKWGRMGSL